MLSTKYIDIFKHSSDSSFYQNKPNTNFLYIFSAPELPGDKPKSISFVSVLFLLF